MVNLAHVNIEYKVRPGVIVWITADGSVLVWYESLQ